MLWPCARKHVNNNNKALTSLSQGFVVYDSLCTYRVPLYNYIYVS